MTEPVPSTSVSGQYLLKTSISASGSTEWSLASPPAAMKYSQKFNTFLLVLTVIVSESGGFNLTNIIDYKFSNDYTSKRTR